MKTPRQNPNRLTRAAWLLPVLLFVGCPSGEESHEGHDHGAGEEHADHDGEDHDGDHAGHDDSAEDHSDHDHDGEESK